MKILFILIFLTSCANIKERGNTPDEIGKNQIVDLHLQKRYLISMQHSRAFKKIFPESKYKAEVDYTLGKTLQAQEDFEGAYSHWLDFQKIYPEFKPEEIKQRITDLKDKKNSPPALGFVEFSYVGRLGESGNLNRFKTNSTYGMNLGYYLHRPGKYVHGIYWHFHLYSYNNITFPGSDLISNDYDIGITHFSIGYSFKVELNKDKLQSIFSLGPNISAVRLYSNNNEIKKHMDIGLNFRASLDYKIYHGKTSPLATFGHGKYYLTTGLNTFYLHKLEFNNSGRKGLNHSWFLGIKL